MSRDLNADTISEINKATVFPFFAVELRFDGNQILRMWTGQGTLVLPDPAQWSGAGTLLGISRVEETSEMAVKGATLTLSSVPSSVLALALVEPYQGRVCKLYFGTFTEGAILQEDSAYILLQDGSKIGLEAANRRTAFNEIFSGYMDQMNIEETGDTSTIELKVENKLIDLERARVARYTSGYQKSLYAGDLGLDFIEDLQDKPVSWGRSSGA